MAGKQKQQQQQEQQRQGAEGQGEQQQQQQQQDPRQQHRGGRIATAARALAARVVRRRGAAAAAQQQQQQQQQPAARALTGSALPQSDLNQQRRELHAARGGPADEEVLDSPAKSEAQPAAMSISDEVVASRPFPGVAAPSQASFSPCRQYLTYLQPESADHLLSRQLFVCDVRKGLDNIVPTKLWDPSEGATETEESLSLEDKLRRERSRQMSVGVTQYAWAATQTRMLIPLNGNIYVKDEATFGDKAAIDLIFDKQATETAGDDSPSGGALDPTLSPSGEVVAFVRDSELYAQAIDGPDNKPVRLTFSARGTGKTNGLADYVAQEEMDRYKGFWFSQDSSLIAFEEVDETHIPLYRIMHQGNDAVGDGAQEDHRYPFAGEANPHVRLGVVDVHSALSGSKPDVKWLDLTMGNGEDDDLYLARVDWLPDNSLAVQLENREQSELQLIRYDLETGDRQILVREKNSIWINLHDLFLSFVSPACEEAYGLGPGDAMETDGDAATTGYFFTWGSERSGFMHLYLYHFNTSTGEVCEIRQLTQGDWRVSNIAMISVDKGVLFFNANASSPVESHVYACRLWGDKNSTPALVQVTSEPGTHALAIDATCTMAVHTWDSLTQPPTTAACEIEVNAGEDGSLSVELREVKVLHDGQSDPLVADQLEALSSALRAPEVVSYQSSDGEVELFSCVYKPDPAKHGNGPYPVIVAVYGGPHVQRVSNSWLVTADMRAQRFADAGYVVVKTDNRGSFNRGLEFEGAIKHRMGTIEVDDQVDGVNHVVSMGLGDKNRVGVYGWSYGGYMSLMTLCQRPDVFHVAVSGAPVTHWDGYDTHYTERYMGTPESNPEGYERGSVMTHVDNLREDSKLMLVHGLIDENVHFRHTARLINAMIASRKKYDLLLFPNERHSPRSLRDRIYMEERIKAYFDENLLARSAH